MTVYPVGCLPPTTPPIGQRCHFCRYVAIAASSRGALLGLADHLATMHPLSLAALDDYAAVLAAIAQAPPQ